VKFGKNLHTLLLNAVSFAKTGEAKAACFLWTQTATAVELSLYLKNTDNQNAGRNIK
jgi:hypothetical protein